MESTTSALINVVEMNGLSKFALLFGYANMVIYVFLVGFCVAKLTSRKKK